MATTTLRTAKHLLLGNELHHMRELADLTQAEAAKLIESRQAKMADLEAGKAVISPGDLLLLELRRDNHKRGFWTTGYHRAYHETIG